MQLACCSPEVSRHAILVARAAGRCAFNGAALVGPFIIIVGAWWWDASLLTAAADENLRLIKAVTTFRSTTAATPGTGTSSSLRSSASACATGRTGPDQ